MAAALAWASTVLFCNYGNSLLCPFPKSSEPLTAEGDFFLCVCERETLSPFLVDYVPSNSHMTLSP